jgi:uncharacterized protein
VTGYKSSEFEPSKYVSLTTFRKDGRGVPTALWFAIDGEDLVAWTVADSGKVKRIRRSGAVTVAACDMRGVVQGEAAPARAVICDATETRRVRSLIAKRYGLLGHLTMTMSRIRRGSTGTVGLRISPA